MHRRPLLVLFASMLGACAVMPPPQGLDQTRAQVFAAERAFAKSMADRDFAAFKAMLSEEAVFFDGKRAIRGKAAVASDWEAYFKEPVAPFAWEPVQIEPLDSGALALSTGPIRNASGKPVAQFNSIWRQEAPGVWRVIFDKGAPLPRESQE